MYVFKENLNEIYNKSMDCSMGSLRFTECTWDGYDKYQYVLRTYSIKIIMVIIIPDAMVHI